MEKLDLKNRPLKVLYISHSIGFDGAERCLFTLVKGIDKDKFIPMVVVPAEGPLKKKLEKQGVKVFIFPLVCWIPIYRAFEYTKNRDMLSRCKRLAVLIKDEGVDIIHTNTSIIAEGAIAAKMTGKPHVWHLHEILDGHPSLNPPMPLHLIYKFIDLYSESIIVVSDALKERLAGSISPEREKVIHNGIEVPESEPAAISLRDEINVPKDTILVCTIGPIIKEKGYETLVEAARSVIKKNKKVVFISIGDIGDVTLSSRLRKAMRKYSIKDSFRFLGYRNDVPRILKEVDIYVVSSKTESFSLAAIEAMAAGKPVVATRCGGPEEIVVHGETGFLIPLDSPEEMAEKILYLIDNPERRAKLGAEGRKRFEAHFTADKYHEAIERYYAEITSYKRELKEEDEKLACSLMELVINLNDKRGREKMDIGLYRKILISFIYVYDVVKQYIEIFFMQGFSVANRRTFGFISNLFRSAELTKKGFR